MRNSYATCDCIHTYCVNDNENVKFLLKVSSLCMTMMSNLQFRRERFAFKFACSHLVIPQLVRKQMRLWSSSPSQNRCILEVTDAREHASLYVEEIAVLDRNALDTDVRPVFLFFLRHFWRTLDHSIMASRHHNGTCRESGRVLDLLQHPKERQSFYYRTVVALIGRECNCLIVFILKTVN